MVGLYDGKVHPRQQVQRFIGNIAGVRKEADAAILRVEPPAAGAGGIVGGGNRRDAYAQKARGAVDGHKTGINVRQPVAQLPAGAGRGENGAGRFLQKRPHAGNMVGMGVGHKNGVQLCRGQLQRFQRGGDAAAGNAGVDQKRSAIAGKQGGIAGGAAGKGMYGGQEKYLALYNEKTSAGERAGQGRHTP